MPDNAERHAKTHVSQLLLAIGDLLEDCHRESLALQREISESLPSESIDLSQLRTYQHLDHITQVHDDLARLIPALAGKVGPDGKTTDDLASVLRLVSLRDRLFGNEREDPPKDPGDVILF